MEKALKKHAPIFVLPTFLAFVIGFIIPFAQGFYLSFCKFTTVGNATFVGISNYTAAIKDTSFTSSFKFTVLFAIVSILLINVLAFGLALLLTQKLKGTNIFRTIFFMPNLIGGIVLGYIWQLIFNHYGQATYIAFFTLFAGLTTILFSLTLGFVYHTSFDMEYLGWCMIMGATWMLGESKIRQLLIPNSSALASLCFVMILLGPIPLLLYADNVQNGLHRRLYHIVIGISLLDFTVCSILAIANIADYIETLPLGQIILIGTFLMVFIHLCLYIRHRKKASDHLLLLAHLLVLLCVAAECVSVYFVTSLSGLFIGIGMLILLFVNIVRTLRSIQHIENERQQQELERKQKQTEILSLQMMQTLSTTIEAKDEYSRGHSYRVAEYAALIAAELGWSSEEIHH